MTTINNRENGFGDPTRAYCINQIRTQKVKNATTYATLRVHPRARRTTSRRKLFFFSPLAVVCFALPYTAEGAMGLPNQSRAV